MNSIVDRDIVKVTFCL